MIQTTKRIVLERANQIFKASIVIGSASDVELDELVNDLNPDELQEFNKLLVNKRKLEYCLGKYVAKKCAASLMEMDNINGIKITKGVFNQPILYSDNYKNQNIQISISHVDNIALSIAFPEEHPMGIDIERVADKNKNVLASQMLNSELKLIKQVSISTISGLTLLWTIKESLSKVLKTGLTTPLTIYSVSQIKRVNNSFISQFVNIPQYKVISWILDQYVVSICLPKNTSIDLNLSSLDLKPIISSPFPCV